MSTQCNELTIIMGQKVKVGDKLTFTVLKTNSRSAYVKIGKRNPSWITKCKWFDLSRSIKCKVLSETDNECSLKIRGPKMPIRVEDTVTSKKNEILV